MASGSAPENGADVSHPSDDGHSTDSGTTSELSDAERGLRLLALLDSQPPPVVEAPPEPEDLEPEPEPDEIPAQRAPAAPPEDRPKRKKRRGTVQGALAASDAFIVEQVVSDRLEGRFCWSPHLGWMQWNRKVWVSADDTTVREDVRLYLAEWVVGQLAQPTAGVGSEDLVRLLGKGRIAGLTDLSRGLLLVNGGEFDTDPDIITVENGVLDLRTSALMPHDPKRYLTRYIPTRFVRGARHPDHDMVLSALSPEVHPWLQIRLGQGITGHVPDDDVMLLLHGDGQNGKSSLVDATSLALGGHTDTGAMTFLDDSVLTGDRDAKEERMALKGARLAFAEELPEGRRLNVTQLKKAVGTLLMKARHLYQREVQWVTSHTLVITTNYKPSVSETDHGTWRRLALVPFPYTFVGGEPESDYERKGDSGLKRRLQGREQREAMLAWLAEGARLWYEADRTMPKHPADVVEATRKWRAESDIVMRYWGERLVADYDSHVMSKELMEDLNQFLGEIGQQSWSQKTAADRFGSHEETKSSKVSKELIRSRAGLSRPSASDMGSGWVAARPEPPARYHAWMGVRFATEADMHS
ncbi:DNA primase family protein [Streptomyces parvus]|uniref:DNA primase family protein n=1 Tax=Streptomyces parvus TaxID=66428 RepID=UPI0021018825|nr:phage/plasmid primase, P4 family [Streptomyces parvus]MCQ1582301.1 phage/plasmid primase, P4 family [Streptomyces parvus]